MTRRVSTWKIVGIVAVVVVALLLIGAFWVRSVTETRWTRFQEEMKAADEKERTRDVRRPPLRGSATPGNAWDDYTLAIDAMKKVQNREKLGELVERTPKADPAWGAAALAQNEGILESLSRGASRSTSRCPYDWAQGNPSSNLLGAMYVVYLAILKSRDLSEAGKPREAVALLLDAAQLGRDVTDDGPMISEMLGVAMLSSFVDAARDLAASAKADAESLSDLEQGLAVLDGSFPKHAGCCLRREHLVSGMIFATQGVGGGFPSKFMYLNALERRREAMEQFMKACEGPWAESLATVNRIDAECRQSWNPITKMLTPGKQSTERYVRDRLAQVRLLRMALRYRRTGERLALPDPFGTTLKSAASESGLKFWSIGADGVDDGGNGDWWSKTGGDVVLEVPR